MALSVTHNSFLPLLPFPSYCLSQAQTAADALAAAESIADADGMAAALLDNPLAEVRQAVAEACWAPAALAALEKAVRGRDKSMNRLLRDRLATLKSASGERAAEDAGSERILAAAAAVRDDDSHYDARRDAIEREWRRHLAAIEATDATLAPFGTVPRDLDALRRRFPARRAAAAVAVAPSVDFEKLLADADALGKRIALLLADEPDADALAAGREALRDLAAEWNAGADASPPPGDLSARFHAAEAKAGAALDAARRQLELAGECRDLLRREVPVAAQAESVNAARREIRRQREAIEDVQTRLAWPPDLPASPLAAALRQRLEELTAAEEQCAIRAAALGDEVAAGLAKLREHLDAGAVHDAVEQDHALRELRKQLPQGGAQALGAELAEAGAKLRELRAWRAYAEAPKRRDLCERMEQLAERPRAAARQAEAVKALLEEWNHLGAAASRDERELRKRFDAAAERAFEPCRTHFQEQAERRKFNLEQRTAIVQALERYVADNDWERADWRGVERVLRQARSEWRQYHPMDRRAGADVAARFEALADDLHGRLKGRWERHRERKEALVEEAKAIRESSDQATDKANAMKALQRRWKEAGPLPRRADQRLWQLFRSECDAVFEARDKVQDRRAEKQRLVSDAQALIFEPERRVDIDPGLNRNTVADYERRLAEFETLPKDLRRRADAILQHADRIAVDRQQAAGDG